MLLLIDTRSRKNQFRSAGSFIVHLIVPLGDVYTFQIKKNSVAPWKEDGVVPRGPGGGGRANFKGLSFSFSPAASLPPVR